MSFYNNPPSINAPQASTYVVTKHGSEYIATPSPECKHLSELRASSGYNIVLAASNEIGTGGGLLVIKAEVGDYISVTGLDSVNARLNVIGIGQVEWRTSAAGVTALSVGTDASLKNIYLHENSTYYFAELKTASLCITETYSAFPSAAGTATSDLQVTGTTTSLPTEGDADIVIYTDGTNMYRKNNHTNTVTTTAASIDLSTPLQAAITALSNSGAQGGVIVVKKSTSPTAYAIPARYTVNCDYTWSTQVTCPEGISVIGYGVNIKAITLDDYHFKYYTIGVAGDPYYQFQRIQKFSGFFFVGLNTNASAGAVWVYKMQQLTEIHQVYTTEMKYGIKLEGSCYRTQVFGCMLEGRDIASSIGVQVIVSGGAYPNASKIWGNDISGFATGIDLNGAYGLPIEMNYFEDDDIAIDNQTANSPPQISGNFFQLVDGGAIGIYTTKRDNITNNYFEMGASTIGIQSGAEAAHSVSGNVFYCAANGSIGIDATAQNFTGAVTGNVIQTSGTAYGMYGKFTRITISGNFFTGAATTQLYNTGVMICLGNWFYNTTTAINNNAGGCLVTGNKFTSCTNDLILTTGNNSYIFGNYFSGAVTKTAGTNYFGYNIGLITENVGTSAITAAATSVTVTHGCSMTPVIGEITITPSAKSTSDPTFYYWVDTITSTQFNVNVVVAPGALTFPFGWAVRISPNRAV